ncbi:muramoyltetrapeptide carboxypeptidase [Streptosporangium becharense]|uniref:Muramoyltetrapeptide carboxypeptidase n=1 Tax=Streptosporangium becharense TaxID=1816182 RepID=A0A7W9ICX3_9ACTN|nr:LD-carboxypeptidase [Streptosporangium becharense]MBB2915257.1 muramoyltetrapeptide carboxypeptidase [Streptosporangium becharense]MBB5817914.1 muramoyltetrapeptide carboxypeptidase [Streptosporangium becharense]
MSEPAMPAAAPPPIRPGDTVAVVTPCGPPDPARLARGIRVLEGLGLKVVTGAHVLDRHRYLAGADAARAADLQEAWCDPAVSAVFCARGGYGATRVLGLLDWDALRAAGPKALVGSSDVTALHSAFAAELGLASWFGPMPACTTISDPGGPEPRTFGHLEAALAGDPAPVAGDRMIVPGDVTAPVTGGNLTLLAALCGTPYALSARGRIVLLEDVGEAPYRIDRMLTQLLQSGALDGAAGFALGSWVGCGDPYPVLEELLAPLGVPVLAGLPVGHGSPQFSVLLGALGAIDAKSCSLTYSTGDVGKAR